MPMKVLGDPFDLTISRCSAITINYFDSSDFDC
jgi:hypothetical protein